MFFLRDLVSLRAPGNLAVTRLRRTTYTTSSTRQGVSDYTVEFAVCREVTGWFGHVATLAASVRPEQLSWTDCQQYSTAFETVQTCSARPENLSVAAGTELGLTGLRSAAQSVIDFGLTDTRVRHTYVAAQRFPPPTLHAICPWEAFDAGNQAILLGKLRDPVRPTVTPSGSPRCGTMQVDVAGTAKGVWAEVGAGQVGGDETRYVTLANYPYRPEEQLALSIGPASAGAVLAVVPRLTSGQVNRAFEHVSADGRLYCYTGDPRVAASWILSVSTNGLVIARRAHAPGASPCLADPSTWSVSGGLALVR
jgi:hypothetical protein